MPTGLAVAGTVKNRLFVSNTAQDTVQVVQLADDLTDMTFVMAPAQRFPLRIPAGQGPGDLAATFDRRFVVVLNLVSESVRLIDADSLLLVRDAVGAVLQMPLGEAGTRPAAMVASPVACPEANCAGRVYVALAGAGAILAVDVFNDENGVRLYASQVFAVGGEPSALAVNPAGPTLFATDASVGAVIRVNLDTGVKDSRDIGGIGGALAVSRDGTMVVVGRPALRDVVVFGAADGAEWGVVDSNTKYAPTPSCVRGCDATVTEQSCEGGHPADLEICADDTGLHSLEDVCRAVSDPDIAVCAGDTTPYQAIYLDSVPTKIVTLGEEQVGRHRLRVACFGDDPVDCEVDANCSSTEVCVSGQCAREQTHGEMAAVALLDGNVVFIGLADESGGHPEPTLIEQKWCLAPSVDDVQTFELQDRRYIPSNINVTSAELSDWLERCPDLPDRARYTCVSDGVGGVGVSFHNTGKTRWRFMWEGIRLSLRGILEERAIPGGTCNPGDCPASATCKGGQCFESWLSLDEDASRTFEANAQVIHACETVSGGACDGNTDAVDKAAWGDIVALTDNPLPDCTGCNGESGADWRALERRILTKAAGDIVAFRLDKYLDAGCFDSAEVDFDIRVADQVVAYPLWLGSKEDLGKSGGEIHLSPGDLMGPGSATPGRFPSELFQIRDDLDPQPNLSSCERYNADGSPLALSEQLSRNRGFWFTVEAPFSLFESGKGFDSRGDPILDGTAGVIPGAMIVSDVGVRILEAVAGSDSKQWVPYPVIFLTYSGSNELLGFVPFDVARQFKSEKKYRLLR
ncbi:MAG: hypothetical protein A2341_13880 [Deltaproteobacteria bacterium RIFOXYB12_FULL_58_9]|nr:MAG: hypothetical protein A2341_13880 [Deltaproteobacteria bacterium RIFOXYB12_FULL_58_9]